MVASADVVRKKLLQIDQATSRLRSWMPVSLETLQTDQKLQWAIERGLQVAAEALFDTGNHILASEFHESVDQYREVPTRLVARGVLSQDTAQRLTSLSGFRNVSSTTTPKSTRRRFTPDSIASTISTPSLPTSNVGYNPTRADRSGKRQNMHIGELAFLTEARPD
jgi:uncharacterized protein YutE (UPF0331/DUF86 family)